MGRQRQQQCVDKCLTSISLKEKYVFVPFGDLHELNIPASANFPPTKLTSTSFQISLKFIHQFLQASISRLQQAKQIVKTTVPESLRRNKKGYRFRGFSFGQEKGNHFDFISRKMYMVTASAIWFLNLVFKSQ